MAKVWFILRKLDHLYELALFWRFYYIFICTILPKLKDTYHISKTQQVNGFVWQGTFNEPFINVDCTVYNCFTKLVTVVLLVKNTEEFIVDFGCVVLY